MLQTTSLLILWLAACALLPGQLEGWTAPPAPENTGRSQGAADTGDDPAGSGANDGAWNFGSGPTQRNDLRF